MSDYQQGSAKTTIAPEVLLTIARLTTLSVPGVSRMTAVSNAFNRLLKKNIHLGEGICLEVTDDTVIADLFVILKNDFNVREVSHAIQHEVARAIDEMVGMTAGQVNVHIEDIEYPEPEA
jgi:uncharacterized alkaline shock family protein YloU